MNKRKFKNKSNLNDIWLVKNKDFINHWYYYIFAETDAFAYGARSGIVRGSFYMLNVLSPWL